MYTCLMWDMNYLIREGGSKYILNPIKVRMRQIRRMSQMNNQRTKKNCESLDYTLRAGGGGYPILTQACTYVLAWFIQLSPTLSYFLSQR